MHVARFARSRGFALAIALAAQIPLSAVEARELRLSHQWPETDARHRAARVIAAEARKRVPDLAIKIHPNSSLKIDPVEQYEALLDGRIEMAVVPLTYLAPKYPEMAIAGLPGVPSNVEMASLLKGSEFEQLLQQLCEEKGFRILSWWWVGGGIASRTQPVTGPATVKGLTMRGGGDFNTMLQASGANVTALPSSQLRAGMESGKLDVVLTSYESLVSFRIPEQTKYATLGGIGIWTAFAPAIISKAVWDSLTGDEQEALDQAAAASNIYFEATQREAEEDTIAAFTKAGAKVQPLAFEDYAAWLHVAKDTSWKHYFSISPTARGLLTALLQSFITSDNRGTPNEGSQGASGGTAAGGPR